MQPPPCPPTPCREWVGAKNKQGYGWKKVGGKTRLVHRWVYSRLNGGFRGIHGKQVMHLCDNPPCFRYDHLWCGTHEDNVAERTRKGRSAKKLTLEDVQEIRAALAGGELQRVIAERYGVTDGAISHISTGETWV